MIRPRVGYGDLVRCLMAYPDATEEQKGLMAKACGFERKAPPPTPEVEQEEPAQEGEE